MTEEPSDPPPSLLPYEGWFEEAQRQVALRALAYAAEHGLPGAHHFYLTFRTDYPGVLIPARLSAQYPDEMTIVLQHQFWDLKVDEDEVVSVGLSFSGIPSVLVIPAGAIVGFADPHVRFGLRMQPRPLEDEDAIAEDEVDPETEETAAEPETSETPQVVSLDAFRRRTPPKE
ncbi:MAG TPA: ClpXP protease specificity-enhancing factor SspB [Acidisoma sp.]|nr:ClpXP protease specificity-enhancing factor SspB [Acidisoma sp.]